MPDFKLVLATGNRHKVDELLAILSPLLPGLTSEQIATNRDLDAPEPIEDAPSFEGNALIKARALAKATGLPTIADDSGLAVDILGSSPGIFSARWSGHHGDDEGNLRLLLNQLADVKPEQRSAQFVCAAALVTPQGDEIVEVGRMHGSLLFEPRGRNGFGYDPIFVPDGYSKTNAELSPDEKNRISHRSKAFRALAPKIVEVLK